MLINKSDYRLGYWENLSNRITKVGNVRQLLIKNNSNNHYTSIRKGRGPYKRLFVESMEGHCSYCGARLGVTLKLREFEIDHINSSNPKNNMIDNLAPACETCNSHKLGIASNVKVVKIIHPYNNLFNVYERQSDFSIIIKDSYKNNDVAISFYDALLLGSQTKRIDYFLDVINHLINEVKQSSFIEQKLKDIFYVFMSKRMNSSNLE